MAPVSSAIDLIGQRLQAQPACWLAGAKSVKGQHGWRRGHGDRRPTARSIAWPDAAPSSGAILASCMVAGSLKQARRQPPPLEFSMPSPAAAPTPLARLYGSGRSLYGSGQRT